MVSPIKNSEGALRVSIYSEGELIKPTLFGLVSLYIFKGVNRIGKSVLCFEAGSMSEGEIPESDSDSFAPGKAIRIEAGYGSDESSLFEGMVVNHSFVVEQNNHAQLRVECCDYAYPATQARKNAVYEKKKDSDVIDEIFKKYAPLSSSVDSTNTKYNELVQYYCTDWDFALSRADANGLVIVTEGKNISVKKPDVSASPKLKISYGTDLIEFNGQLSASDSQASIDAFAWNPAEQAMTKASGKTPTLNEQGNTSPKKLSDAIGVDKYILQTGFAEEAVLQDWADSQLLKAGLSRIQGFCKFIGSAKALPGETLELDRLGERFNGTAYIGYVEHEIRNGEWTTTAGLGLAFENITDKPSVVSPPASGLLPGIEGLHIGKVTKISDDPSSENKIQVSVPLLGDEANLLWARQANFWASNGYGSFFIPDVDDEVVVGFFNNDPCYPVILGSLYSSKQQPPYSLTKENQIRAMLTKEKIKVEVNDKDKSITLETPGKNIVTISDKEKGIVLKDQHGNKIVTEAGGITIESAKDLTLKAKMNVVIEAGTNLDAKAKTNLTMKGLKVEASASTELTVKGSAKAELSAAGQTVVKGGMVMIN